MSCRVTSVRLYKWIVLAITLVSLAGCESLFLGESSREQNMQGSNVTRNQLRMTIRGYVNPMTGLIRNAANTIEAETDDPEIKDAALYWKATAVPAVRETLFSPQPLIALVDTWALGYQMMDYFEHGRGKELFGPYAPIGYEASKEIAERMEALYAASDASDSIGRAQKLIREWATQNPIVGAVDARESIYNRATSTHFKLGMSFRDTVDTMVNNVDDLNRKLGVYSDQLPEQMRWQAELFTRKAYDDLRIEEATDKIMPLLDTTEGTMEQAKVLIIEANGLMQDFPELIEAERENFKTFWDAERAGLMDDFTAQVDLAIIELEKNRVAISQDIRAERLEFQAFISKERETALSEIEDIRSRLISDFYDKALCLLIYIAIYLFLLVCFVLWIVRKREA